MSGYKSTYFLVVDGRVLYYSKGYKDVLEKLADLYGDYLYIEYYGLMGRSGIVSLEYMDLHEGCTAFIGNTWIENDRLGKRDIDIYIVDVNYVLEYSDTDFGVAVLEWLRDNPGKYQLNFDEGQWGKYCVIVNGSLEGDFNSLDRAFDYLKKGKVYSSCRVGAPSEKEVLLRDLGLGALKHDNGF